MDYTGTDNLELMAEAINYNRFLVQLVKDNVSKNDRILDFGSGIGTFAKRLSKDGLLIECMEPDEMQFQQLLNSGLKTSRNILDVEDSIFDSIYSFNVLEHIKEDSKTLAILRRKLKRSGRLLIYVPAMQILFSSMDKKVGHYRRYSLNELKRIVSDNGFKIIEIRYIDSIGFLATLIYKLIGRKDGGINKNSLIIYDRFVFPVSIMLDKIFSPFLGKMYM